MKNKVTSRAIGETTYPARNVAFEVNGKAVMPMTNNYWRFVGEVDGAFFKADLCSPVWGGQTASELEIYFNLSDADRKYFPRVLDWGVYETSEGDSYVWMLQTKLDLIDATADGWMEIRPICWKYGIGDVRDPEMDDNPNWGMTPSGPVVYDWGVNRERESWGD